MDLFSAPRARKVRRTTSSTDPLDHKPSTPDLPADIDRALGIIRSTLVDCDDLVIRELSLTEALIRVAILYIDGMVDSRIVNSSIIQSIVADSRADPAGAYSSAKEVFRRIQHMALGVGSVRMEADVHELVTVLLVGQRVILVDGQKEALLADGMSPPGRSITEPSAESIIRGPRESFVELQRINTALLRKHLRTPDLKL